MSAVFLRLEFRLLLPGFSLGVCLRFVFQRLQPSAQGSFCKRELKPLVQLSVMTCYDHFRGQVTEMACLAWTRSHGPKGHVTSLGSK